MRAVKRSDIPKVRAGTWVQFSKVAPVDNEPPHTVHLVDFGELGSIRITPEVLREAGFTVRVFDYEPGPTELVMPKEVVARAVAAEMDAATARTEARAAEAQATETLEQLNRVVAQRRKRDKMDTFLRNVGRAREQLLEALLEYADSEERRAGPLVPLTTAFADALRQPCPAYEGDAEPIEYDAEPMGEGAPCVRVYNHEGDHATVQGRRFTAPLLFVYPANPFRKEDPK